MAGQSAPEAAPTASSCSSPTDTATSSPTARTREVVAAAAAKLTSMLRQALRLLRCRGSRRPPAISAAEAATEAAKKLLSEGQ
eukprot:CAMPEP_0203843072 /NCGR_PEP_ID=MMETSP0359-20131031/2381_1 /ASSEMBLY_ACC=CAM_ASM_000338 /TAXON_ID=268821 /ORGANISM="Scrippsiella Hangoei, Strain SHTV-5" /LENGTH=82 /DNA_ID=CAMNT_0050757785 /DNA_START=144 /DNA_END=392 /DNA_ORIENTATION=-